MKSVSFSAPGKLVIAGEYAVLEGFEALAVSIGRRAHVTAEESTSNALYKSRNKLLKSIADEFAARGLELPPVALKLDSSELHMRSDKKQLKLGLGSSSAIAVALTAALLRMADYDIQDAFRIAFSAHRRFNNHRGSGIDVATCYYGGAIRYKLSNEGPRAKKCDLTFNMSLIIPVYTGIAQSTGIFLEKMSKAPNKTAYREAIEGIGNAASRMIALMTSSSSFADLKNAVEAHNYWMSILGAQSDANLLASPHLRLAELCERYDGFAKPSGAGGGDISLCFVPLDAQSAFQAELSLTSFQALDLDFCVSGLESI